MKELIFVHQLDYIICLEGKKRNIIIKKEITCSEMRNILYCHIIKYIRSVTYFFVLCRMTVLFIYFFFLIWLWNNIRLLVLNKKEYWHEKTTQLSFLSFVKHPVFHNNQNLLLYNLLQSCLAHRLQSQNLAS